MESDNGVDRRHPGLAEVTLRGTDKALPGNGADLLGLGLGWLWQARFLRVEEDLERVHLGHIGSDGQHRDRPGGAVAGIVADQQHRPALVAPRPNGGAQVGVVNLTTFHRPTHPRW